MSELSSGTVLWDVSDPDRPRTVGPPLLVGTEGGSPYDVAFSPDGSTLVVAISGGDGPGGAYIWNIADPEHPTLRETPTPTREDIRAVAFSRDGSMLAVGGSDGRVSLRPVDGDRIAAAPVGVVDVGESPMYVTFTPDGAAILVKSVAGTGIWDVTDPRRTRRTATLDTDSSNYPGIVVSADGNHVFGGRGETTIALWSLAELNDRRADPVAAACALAVGGLTPDQWAHYLPDDG